MPAGDAQRTWFSEMIDILREGWSDSLSWDEIVHLRDLLDETLQRIRTAGRILPPMMYCRACGRRHRSAPPRVSVRALLLALPRYGIASERAAKELERRWSMHRKANGLDLYGKGPGAETRPLDPAAS
jgi:hypothetical protein